MSALKLISNRTKRRRVATEVSKFIAELETDNLIAVDRGDSAAVAHTHEAGAVAVDINSQVDYFVPVASVESFCEDNCGVASPSSQVVGSPSSQLHGFDSDESEGDESVNVCTDAESWEDSSEWQCRPGTNVLY